MSLSWFFGATTIKKNAPTCENMLPLFKNKTAEEKSARNPEKSAWPLANSQDILDKMEQRRKMQNNLEQHCSLNNVSKHLCSEAKESLFSRARMSHRIRRDLDTSSRPCSIQTTHGVGQGTQIL